MGKIVSRVRQLRLDYSQRIGRDVTIGEAAESIGISRVALSRLENDQTEQVSFDTLAKIITFYAKALDKQVTAADVLGYDPNNRRAAMTGAPQAIPA